MSVLTDTDRASMLAALGAETMLYQPVTVGGYSFDVSAKFDFYDKSDPYGEVEVEGSRWEITVAASDVPDIRHEDTFIRSDNTTWTVKKIRQDHGFLVLTVKYEQ